MNKIGRSKVLNDTPSVRGMINKVDYLVKIEKLGSSISASSAPLSLFTAIIYLEADSASVTEPLYERR